MKRRTTQSLLQFKYFQFSSLFLLWKISSSFPALTKRADLVTELATARATPTDASGPNRRTSRPWSTPPRTSRSDCVRRALWFESGESGSQAQSAVQLGAALLSRALPRANRKPLVAGGGATPTVWACAGVGSSWSGRCYAVRWVPQVRGVISDSPAERTRPGRGPCVSWGPEVLFVPNVGVSCLRKEKLGEAAAERRLCWNLRSPSVVRAARGAPAPQGEVCPTFPTPVILTYYCIL